ncbi:MAG: aldo/keto reductase [Methylocystaceae bacterium]
MEYRYLGNTGIKVSRICFGALTVGPLQAGLSPAAGGQVLAYALEKGINFVDTAQLYGTYAHIREGMKMAGIRPVITSKSYCYTRSMAKEALEQALDELQVDWVDIFMLHEQESELTLAGHDEALCYLAEAKAAGRIRALGMSTHAIRGVRGGIAHPDIEIIHPLINIKGLGIMDGTREEMLAAIHSAYECGKGLYGMKALGGGNLINQAYEAFSWAFNQNELASVAVGMQTEQEVDLNLAWAEGRREPALESKLGQRKRRLHIEEWCQGCGQCVESCSQQALYLEDKIAHVWADKCLLCGYCAAACPQFGIRIF